MICAIYNTSMYNIPSQNQRLYRRLAHETQDLTSRYKQHYCIFILNTKNKD